MKKLTTPEARTDQFWTLSIEALLEEVQSRKEGLTNAEASQRSSTLSKPPTALPGWRRDLRLFMEQYRNPLVWLLIAAVTLSLSLGEWGNSGIILLVLLGTGVLSFIQERNAGRAVEKLQAMIRITCRVKRREGVQEISPGQVVRGDVVLLKAGDIIPADGRLLEANDLHVDESMLTGESFPAEKARDEGAAADSLLDCHNSLFQGTHVISGSALLLVVHTGQQTAMGKMIHTLNGNNKTNAFDEGIRHFGYLLMRITVIMALMVFILHVAAHRPVADSLLFSLALAVGLAPELLPAIITITLSAGARRLAERKVIVRKLNAIECLGQMTILCCDKTGTLTQGLMTVQSAVDVTGADSSMVMQYARLNACFESGFTNPIDEALKQGGPPTVGFTKKDEVPYDFIRKRLSVVVDDGARHLMITKGAVPNILACCQQALLPDGSMVALDTVQPHIGQLVAGFSASGLRTIAVCFRDVTGDPVIDKDDEQAMVFLGLLGFSDPLKAGISQSLALLQQKGIGVKVITGDHRLIAQQVAGQIGLPCQDIICGHELIHMSPEALQQKIKDVAVFAEIEPLQKEGIIRALQNNGEVVGFLGDGINDAGALRTADAGISMDTAVDVAREAASLVLLEKNLDVIRDGITEGRKTFGNTLKYIFVTASANFGNMFSMALASVLLPFLPLLPVQILLNNFLSDIPALLIASDEVDAEWLEKPRRWDMGYIKRFMIVFGLQSSFFDLLTFGVLLFIFHTSPDQFRTGWFMESLWTEVLILLVIRSSRPFFKSLPSKWLLTASIAVLLLGLLIPYLPLAPLMGFVRLPAHLLLTIAGIAGLYFIMGEITKKRLMRSY